MTKINVTELKRVLVKGVRMIVAVRRLARDVELDCPELAELEREVRDAAGEVQKVEKEIWESGDRPHVTADSEPEGGKGGE